MATKTIRPVKARNLGNAVQAAAASAAFAGEYKPTPAKADWNKMVQAIGISCGYLRVPYAFGLTLLPVWTASYKAAQKGHVPAKPVTIAKSVKKSVKKSVSKSVNENSTKSDILTALAALAEAVKAL
jgi:hypothetical protein